MFQLHQHTASNHTTLIQKLNKANATITNYANQLNNQSETNTPSKDKNESNSIIDLLLYQSGVNGSRNLLGLEPFTPLLLQTLFSPVLPDLHHGIFSPSPTFLGIHRHLVPVPADLGPGVPAWAIRHRFGENRQKLYELRSSAPFLGSVELGNLTVGFGITGYGKVKREFWVFYVSLNRGSGK